VACHAELIDCHSCEKSLRLVISFGSLKRSQFVSALEERLKPALAKVMQPVDHDWSVASLHSKRRSALCHQHDITIAVIITSFHLCSASLCLQVTRADSASQWL
jgi:hypothetical protein